MSHATRLAALERHAAERDPRVMLTPRERRARLALALGPVAESMAAGPDDLPHAPPAWRRAAAARIARDCAAWLADADAGAGLLADPWITLNGGEADAARERLEAKLRRMARSTAEPPDPERESVAALLAWYDYGGGR